MPGSVTASTTSARDIIRLSLPIPFGPRQVNCYLFDDGEGFTLVDAGASTPEADESFRAQLAARGIARTALRRLILTHYHVDHSGQAFRVRHAPDVEVMSHPADLPLLQNFGERGDESLRTLLRLLAQLGMPPEALDDVATGIRWLRGLARPAPVSRLLTSGETIGSGGRRWEVVSTPGHTPGHISLLDADGGILVGGDLLTRGGPPYVGLLPGGDPEPLGTFLESLARLEATGVRRCLPGHGAPIDDCAVALRVTAGALRAECDRVAALLGPEPETPYTLLLRLRPVSTPPFQQHAALLALGARLAHLAAKGRAELVNGEAGAILYRDRRGH